MTVDILSLSATGLLQGYAKHSLSPVEVVEATFSRIDQANPQLNALTVEMRDSARQEARASEERWQRNAPKGLLDGLPVAIKDLTPLKGVPARQGSLTTSEGDCDWDAPRVQNLRKHGAIFTCKTTTPEFGWKGTTDSPLSGITCNPWNLERTPAGSSGGAAAAVAAGMVALSEGTDGAGSIRMPAAYCGVFGLYPTAGRIPYIPLSTIGEMGQSGPMTRTVADATLMFAAMVGDGRQDHVGLTDNDKDWRSFPGQGVQGLRVAYSPTLGYANPDQETLDLTDKALSVLQELGIDVTLVDHVFDDPLPDFKTLYSAAMAKICGAFSEMERALLDPGLRKLAEAGQGVSAVDYIEANMARGECALTLNRLFSDFDALITPQMPFAAFEAGRDFPAGRGMQEWFEFSPYTYPFNFTNFPACATPCGFTTEHLPVAFQTIAPRYREDTLFRIASAYEARNPFPMPGPHLWRG